MPAWDNSGNAICSRWCERPIERDNMFHVKLSPWRGERMDREIALNIRRTPGGTKEDFHCGLLLVTGILLMGMSREAPCGAAVGNLGATGPVKVNQTKRTGIIADRRNTRVKVTTSCIGRSSGAANSGARGRLGTPRTQFWSRCVPRMSQSIASYGQARSEGVDHALTNISRNHLEG